VTLQPKPYRCKLGCFRRSVAPLEILGSCATHNLPWLPAEPAAPAPVPNVCAAAEQALIRVLAQLEESAEAWRRESGEAYARSCRILARDASVEVRVAALCGARADELDRHAAMIRGWAGMPKARS
jgi:hypothetical protein